MSFALVRYIGQRVFYYLFSLRFFKKTLADKKPNKICIILLEQTDEK